MLSYASRFVDNATVADALAAAPWFFSECAYLMITRLDSGPPGEIDLKRVRDVSAAGARPFTAYITADAILMTGLADAAALARADIFLEYDEIVMSDRPPTRVVGKFTSERFQADPNQDLPADMVREFLENSVERAASDGIGLNIIGRDRDAVERCAAAVSAYVA